MRILLDCSQVRIGGGIQVTLGMLRNAANDHSHEWHAVVSGELAEECDPELAGRLNSLIVLPSANGSWDRMTAPRRYLPKIETQVQPDLVLSAFGPSYWKPRSRHIVGFAYGWLLYPDSIVFSRMGLLSRLKWRMIDQIKSRDFLQADALIGETEVVRQRLFEVLGFPLDRIAVVRNTYSQTFVESLRSAVRVRVDDVFRILVPAQSYPNKNLELIPPTAARLRELTANPFRFVFTLPENQSAWKRLSQNFRQAGLQDCVTNLGPVRHDQIAQAYRDSDAVFLPTLLECSTAVFPEAFCAEVPLATSDLDFAHELCGNAALYFDPLSPDAAATALVRLVQDAELRATLISAGIRALSDIYVTPQEKWQETLQAIMVLDAAMNSRTT